MPGGFWQPTSRSGQRTSRRRRSLLGRRNHSENDLSQQGQQLQQQQLSSSQHGMQQTLPSPHTAIVIPENVKTILIAGTPECWNLSTSASPYPAVPTTSASCDVSVVSQYSELSPATSTIEEDEPYLESPTIRQNTMNNLDWLLAPPPKRISPSNNSRRNTGKPPRAPTATSRSPKDPRSMVVMYRSPTPAPPQQALQLWLNSAEALLRSNEMSVFVNSTRDIVKVAGGIAIRTAFLPVTLPLHVACATKDFVGWSIHQAVSQTGAMLHLTDGQTDVSNQQQPSSSKRDTTTDSSLERSDGGGNPFEGLFYLAGKIKDEIGATVVGLLLPPNHADQQALTQDDKILERLRLPSFAEEESTASISSPASLPKVTKADFSKYLLRMEDLGIMTPDSKQKVIYIDLSAEYRDESLLKRCLDVFAKKALALATDHAPAIPPVEANDKMDVEWKTEGSTAKMLRKKPKQTPQRWEETIRSDILVWSGSFKNKCGGSKLHDEYPLFVAKGVVEQLSPREFLEVMWDNRRTCDYNVYCLGREDILQIDDEILLSKTVHTGSKVVRSETRVPFTSLSVTLLTLMHCTPLPGGPEEGYMIVSRSLLSGMAGSHTCHKHVQKPKSEILWGVNILRAVPGHPGQTELTSLSQVASSMVPKFLSQKIGLMGVEDFFSNIRKVNAKKACSSPTSPTSSLSGASQKAIDV